MGTIGKKKCYVLVVSRYFGKNHKKAGEPTNFVEKILSGEKLHTIRLNFPLWEKRFKEVEEDKAYISLRYWLDAPYKSPQEEFLQLHKEDGIGIQKLSFPLGVFIDDYDADVSIEDIAKNDGLSWVDFKEWFGEINRNSEYVIIQFSAKRYLNSFSQMEYHNLNFTYNDGK